MTLSRLRPFGGRRKTYFYGVAGFVLAAHVVLGHMIYVMPPSFDDPAPAVASVEMQLVDYVLPDEAIETGAVQLIERPDVEIEVAEPADQPLSFSPVWEPADVAPQTEPLGPTVTDLPALAAVVETIEADEEKKPVVTSKPPAPKPKPKPKASPASTKKPKPKPKAKSSSSPTRRTATRTRPRATPPKPKPTPIPIEQVPRAIPTGKEPERKGMLDRIRDRRGRN